MKSTPTVILAMILITMTGTACGQNVERDSISTAADDTPRTTSTATAPAEGTVRFPTALPDDIIVKLTNEPSKPLFGITSFENEDLWREFHKICSENATDPTNPVLNFLREHRKEARKTDLSLKKGEVKLVLYTPEWNIAGMSYRVYFYEYYPPEGGKLFIAGNYRFLQ